MTPSRSEVVADTSLHGRVLCRALSDATDAWLADLFAAAVGEDAGGVALVAVGGYGRGELTPGSDLDLWLLHDGRADIKEVAERLWYPIWDAKLALGHAVRTPKQALQATSDDLDSATAALSARHVVGDPAVGAGLAEAALERWRKRSGRWLGQLAAWASDPGRTAVEVAFLLEPDVKEGRGGLRDVHALRWAEAARPVLQAGDLTALDAAEDVLLAVRVELHRVTGRASDVLLLERQDDVAAALADADADALMARVAAAARTVAWTADEVWSRTASSPGGRLFRRDRALGPGVVLREGEVHLDAPADPATDPGLVLRAAAGAATTGTRIDRRSLDRLADGTPAYDGAWPDGAREDLVSLLAAGSAAIPVLEALDQRRLVERVLPEWSHTRSRPQRNALHRFTVDRHLVQAAANAATLTDLVPRPDLLLVGALLHDIGKGLPGDHTEVGMGLMADVAARMGFPPDDVETLVDLVRHHLLLPDVATRRDLSDDDVIGGVASAVGSLQTLQLLAALTEADSLATGPSAWGPWKAELVGELVDRVAHVLRGGAPEEVPGTRFPGPEVRALLQRGEQVLKGEGDVLTVVARDRPGLFSRVAGALTLRGLTVLSADAASTDEGMAASQFRVLLDEEVDWDAVVAEVRRALDGRIAIEARLADRANTYRRSSAALTLAAAPSVRIDNAGSGSCTIVEVRAPDRVGVLWRITRALADLDLDIRLARVSTLGSEVVDAFYVQTATGQKVTDRDHQRELERAILHSLS